jgi:hypothetical protein
MIKKTVLVSLLLCQSIFLYAAEIPSNAKVYAYYFHGTVRCPTCQKLEQYSKEAIGGSFRDALDSGKLEFQSVNVEDGGNEHFVSEYQLYTKALVLSFVEDGREVRSKNLTKIWEFVGDKQRFYEYVRQEVSDFLKGP